MRKDYTFGRYIILNVKPDSRRKKKPRDVLNLVFYSLRNRVDYLYSPSYLCGHQITNKYNY